MVNMKALNNTKQKDLNALNTEIFEIIGHIVSSFSSPIRLKIIQILANSEYSVEELSLETGESIANISQHLQRLAKVKIVSCQKKGVSRIYKIHNPKVLELCEKLFDLAHEIENELDIKEDLLTNTSLLSSSETDKILDLVSNDKATLLDVRTAKESNATLVPGAIALPLINLKKAITKNEIELSKSKPIYVYCRGRYCNSATDAVKFLRTQGYKAYRLRESPFKLRTSQECIIET